MSTVVVRVHPPLHSLWGQVFLQVLLQVLDRECVGLGAVVCLLVVGVVQEGAGPGAHVVGRHHPPQLRREDLRVDELVEAVEVVAMHEDLSPRMQGEKGGQLQCKF